MIDKKKYESRLRQAITALTICVIAGCYLVPEFLIVKLSLPMPISVNVLPSLVPLLLTLIWILTVYNGAQYGLRIKFGPSDSVILVTISFWALLEVVQSITYREPNISRLILPYFWFYLSCYALSLCMEYDWLRGVFKKCLILIPVLMCLLQWAMYLGLIPGEPVSLMHLLRGDHPAGSHINVLSYISVICLWFIIFNREDLKYHFSEFALICFFYAQIVINQTRMGLMLLLVIVVMKGFSLMPRNLKLISILFSTIIFVFIIFSIMSLSEPMKIINSIQDDSVRQRIGANYTFMIDGLNNWTFGQGAERGLSVRFEGVLAHNFNIRVFHAYGVFGLLFFLLSLLSLFYRSRLDINAINFSGFVVLQGIIFFEPYWHLWYALIPIASNVLSDQQRVSLNIKKNA